MYEALRNLMTVTSDQIKGLSSPYSGALQMPVTRENNNVNGYS